MPQHKHTHYTYIYSKLPHFWAKTFDRLCKYSFLLNITSLSIVNLISLSSKTNIYIRRMDPLNWILYLERAGTERKEGIKKRENIHTERKKSGKTSRYILIFDSK